MKLQKLLLSVGAVAAVVAPVASVVACGSSNNSKDKETDLAITQSVQKLKDASPEDLIGGLSAQGKTLSHFLIVVGKDDKGFDVRTCFESRGKVNDFTNRLVFDEADKGEHDYVLVPGFDKTKIHLGDVITEELNTDNPVTTTSDRNGKTFSYGLVPNSKISFQLAASRTSETTNEIIGAGSQIAPVSTQLAEDNVFSGGVTTPDTISQLKALVPGYYDELDDDATGQTLFNELRAIQETHLTGVGSYGDLWETYKSAFIDKYNENDGTILDIYSENPKGTDPYKFNPGTSQDHGSHSHEGDSYNREHMIPQSVFGKDAQHIHNDAHFIYPTDSVVNGDRSNFPYDDVDSPTKTFQQGGKLGTGSNGGTAFEPIDAFKGDVARATLYFVLTWKGTQWDQHKTVFAPFGGSAIGGIKRSYLKTYLEWDHVDAISQFDIDRNNAIAKSERGIRNPFVDMPKLVDLIWTTTGGQGAPLSEK